MPANGQHQPTYNVKAVIQETGLKPDTLRVWERRYGLPQPDRTSGGHRLYSQEDILILKWLIARQQEGLSISRAVELWRHLELQGQNPLQQNPADTLATQVSPLTQTSVGGNLQELREAWINACIEFNEQQAEFILTQAFALYPPEKACVELLLPALSYIGQGWYTGKYTVQQEHFASALATRRLETLLTAAPAPIRAEKVVVGCPPKEEHTVIPLLLTLLLRRQGWNVVYLGANIPMAHLEATINTTKPQLIILTAQHLPAAATLRETAKLIKHTGVPLAFGGQIFGQMPALCQRIPGHFLGEEIVKTPQVVDQLIKMRSPVPDVDQTTREYQLALTHFYERQPLIDAAVWQSMHGTDMSDNHLNAAGYNLSSNIIAALILGDMNFLQDDIGWVEGLLTNYQLPKSIFHNYLRAYQQAALEQLDERGKPVINWLNQLVDSIEQ